MLKFLVTVVLALFIFIPACNLVSGLFLATSQAEKSFDSLVKEIKQLKRGKDKSLILIMDQYTTIFYFKANEPFIFE